MRMRPYNKLSNAAKYEHLPHICASNDGFCNVMNAPSVITDVHAQTFPKYFSENVPHPIFISPGIEIHRLVLK